MKKVRVLAYFLPQFHDCILNSKWWGKGFTEWDNVKKCSPLFEGHNQPKIPLESYYDLSDPLEIQKQYLSAYEHGIDGFVIYHYWSLGERPLRKPLDIILNNQNLVINFSLCWANHSWTRSWKNRKGALDVLIEQKYENNNKDLDKHFYFLNRAFSDNRYIRIDGKPFFLIYNASDIPNIDEFIEKLREYVLRNSNLEIHLCGVITSWKSNYNCFNNFDSVTFSQPGTALWSPEDVFSKMNGIFKSKNKFSYYTRGLPFSIKKLLYNIQDNFKNKYEIFDYDEIWEKVIRQTIRSKDYKKDVFPSAFIDFDNSPRYGSRAKIFQGFTPEKFASYLEELMNVCNSQLILINAWNEWGEGMYLQADQKYKNVRLEKLSEVVKRANIED